MAQQGISDKLKRKLGLDAAMVLQTAMAPQNAGTTSRSEYKMFWKVMNPKECSVFLVEVLKRITERLDGIQMNQNSTMMNSSSSSGMNQENTPSVSVDALLNTLAFITLHQEFKQDEGRVRVELNNFQKAEQSKANLPAAKDIMRYLSLRVDGNDMIGPLIIGCSTLHSVDEFQRLSNMVQYPTLDDAEIRSAESIFIYPHLKNLCRMNSLTNNKLSTIVQSTVSKMLTLPQQMKVNPKVAETTFSALLHMLKSFLSVSVLSESPTLKTSLQVLQQFYLWPLPFGLMTKDMLIKLNQEFLFPGNFLRTKLFEETQTVEYRMNSIAAQQQGLTPDVPYSPLMYFINREEESTVHFLQTMEIRGFQYESQPKPPNVSMTSRGKLASANSNSTDLPPVLTTTIQASVLLNALYHEFGTADREFEQIKSMTSAEIASLFKKLFQLMKDVMEKPDQHKDLRNRTLGAVRAAINSSHSNAEAVRFPDGYGAPYTPLFPEYAHVMLPQRISYQFHVKDKLEDDWPTTPHVEDFLTLIQHYAASSTPTLLGDKPLFRVILAGGDELLNSFLCAYLKVYTSLPHVLDSLRLRFYILPTARNHLASFLARHDSWYNRHVYLPFRSPQLLIPHMRPELDKLEDGDKEFQLAPPGIFLRSLVENYVMEAEHTTSLSIYKCEAWMSPSTKKDCDQLIPFLQRLEIGASVGDPRYAGGGYGGIGMGAGGKIESKIDDNLIPPEIQIRFIKMDLTGRTSDPIRDDGAPYTSILLAAVPRKHDQVFPPDPRSDYLELYAKFHRSFQKSAQKSNLLANDPRQHVVEVEVMSVNSSQPFGVVIDGQYFGPFFRIKVSPVLEEKEKMKRIRFPIQTFFPLDD